MRIIAIIAGALMISLSGYAQGTVNFANIVPAAGINAKITGWNGEGWTGPNYLVQLYAGPAGSTDSQLMAISPPARFLDGPGAGYFSAGTRTLPNVAPGAPAVVQVRAWDVTTGATWETATVKGVSALLNVAATGGGSPPVLPANLVGLQGFSIIPEPTAVPLALLGGLALLFQRRSRLLRTA